MMATTDSWAGNAGLCSRLRSFLESEMGISMDDVNLQEVLQQVDRDDNAYEGFDQLASAVASSIAVHETYFLRHREQFDWIEQVWLPEIVAARQAGDTVRIFSGGCATGEEPYSLYAHLSPRLAVYGIRLAVDAVDISQQALDKARQGRYGLWSLRGVSAESERDWLDVASRSVTVKDWVRKGVCFHQHNLLQLLAPAHCYDLVLCRNVMIYMHSAAIAQTLQNLACILAPAGVIVPGPSDPNPPSGTGLAVRWHGGCRLFMREQDVSVHSEPVVPQTQLLPAATVPVVKPAALHSMPAKPSWTDTGLIESLVREGYYDRARQLLEANIECRPLDVRSHILLCLMALDLDDLSLAERAAREAAYLEPDALFTVYLIGNVKARQGDTEGAYAEFMWVWQQLRHCDENQSLRYCEDITVAQFKEIVRARFS